MESLELLLNCLPVVILVQGVAAAAAVDLAAPEGEQWIVASAWGVHDDVAAVNCGWGFHDGTTEQDEQYVSVAAGIPVSLYANNPLLANNNGNSFVLPVILNKDFHVTFKGAVGAGKKLYIKAIVYKIRGLEPWSSV